MGIETMYAAACRNTTDICEHLPTLRAFSSQCKIVVELGTGRMNSTVALVAGKPDCLLTVDLNENTGIEALRRSSDCVTNIIHVIQDTRAKVVGEGCVMPHCDMVFIDSWHTEQHFLGELRTHAGLCRKWIFVHDIVTFGECGQDGEPGLRSGVNKFLLENTQWEIVAEWRNNNGLLMLGRRG